MHIIETESEEESCSQRFMLSFIDFASRCLSLFTKKKSRR